MGSSDGEGLSQLYLELVGNYKKRFMPQMDKLRTKVFSNMEENKKKF